MKKTQIKTAGCLLILISMGTIKKITENKCCQGYGKTGTRAHCQ